MRIDGPTSPRAHPRARVLVVDDDEAVRALVRRLLRQHLDLEVVESATAEEALARLEVDTFDLVVTDLRLPLADGFAVLERLQHRQPGTPAIVLTGDVNVRTCVAAMKLGAVNFVTKPFTASELDLAIEAALTQRAAARDVTASPIARSSTMCRVLDQIDRVARTDATVLIRGETGTGKQMLARLVHDRSSRALRPFVAVNCGAIPEGLVESELFGHASAAFPEAGERGVGKILQAQRGTIFLDEIGEVPLATQVKLLRLLQEREVTPIGAAAPVPVDVRVVAATHRDLGRMVAEGTFREDLLYRLQVVPVEVPPLRERIGDVRPLAAHFIELAAQRRARRIELTREALEVLDGYHWPGNVRELENLIERLAITSPNDVVGVAALPERLRAEAVVEEVVVDRELPAECLDLERTLGSIEQALIDEALQRTAGNRTGAAHLLGLRRTTLVEKIRRRSRA